jgi:predicted permease
MAWVGRIRNVFRQDALSRELDDELEFHIAELIDELVEGGMDPAAARREARRRFGNYTVKKEEVRGMDIARSLEAFVGDLRYGARQLRLNPGFAAVAVLSLALGIGANSAIFQLINALRLRSLPEVRNAEELVALEKAPEFYSSGWFSARHPAFTYAQIEQIWQQQQSFTGLLAFGTNRFNLSRGGEARYAEGMYVTPNFLEALGVAPMLGAWLPADADPRDCSGAGVLLDYAFWQREFGGDPAAVGRDITLNGHSFPILAVTPPTFTGVEAGRRFDLAVPLCADGVFAGDGKGRLANMTAWWLTGIGRLKPGWTVERASHHMRDISPSVFRATQPSAYRPESLEKYVNNKLTAVSAKAGVSSLRRQYANPLWILLASTGLVLVIACANLANLLLARASARGREVALRQAVGASRRRLVAQLMSESVLLASFGAVLGGVLAYLLSRGLVLFLSQGEERIIIPLGLDWRVFGFTVALALVTCLLFGLTPALRASSAAPAAAMRGGRGSAAGSESHALRRTLVVSQIALSLILLVGALLFGQSLRNLLQAEMGMVSDGVLLAGVTVSLPNLEEDRRRGVFLELQERIASLPGVESAAMVAMTPFSGNGWNQSFHADDDPERTGGKEAWLNRVGPGYFGTMKTSLLAGRDFTPHDDLSAPAVAIINEKLARQLYGDSEAIGRSFRYEATAGNADPTFQVVGVVRNTKYNGLREDDLPIAFLPVAQDERSPEELNFAVRTRGSFSSAMAGVRERLAEVDPSLLVEFRILDLQVSQSVLRERLMANLTGGFGLLAALLSTLGLYGVMSYMVAKRRNEIGVRLALGAERADIRRLVFGEAGRLLLVGLALGLAGSFALSRYAESLLFGLAPNDALTLGLGCSLLALTAAAATMMPVRRATSLDPAVVLRDD